MTEIKVKALSKKADRENCEEWCLTRQYSKVVPKREFSKVLLRSVNGFVKRIDKMIEKKYEKLNRGDKKELIDILDYQNVPHKLILQPEVESEDESSSDKENEDPES